MYVWDDVEAPRVGILDGCRAAKEKDRSGSISGNVGEHCRVDCPACRADTVSTMSGVTKWLRSIEPVLVIE